MFDFRQHSIKAKLTLLTMLTSGVALLISATLFGFNDVRQFRNSMVRDLQTLADVIGASATSALEFDDEAAATKTLAPLENKPSVLTAAIFQRMTKFSRPICAPVSRRLIIRRCAHRTATVTRTASCRCSAPSSAARSGSGQLIFRWTCPTCTR